MSRSPLGGPLEHAAAKAVRQYLDALRDGPPPNVGRRRSAVERRLVTIDSAIAAAPPMHALRLVQERNDLRRLLSWYAVEDAFVEVARPYSRRHGISSDTWREMGVPRSVLRRARMR